MINNHPSSTDNLPLPPLLLLPPTQTTAAPMTRIQVSFRRWTKLRRRLICSPSSLAQLWWKFASCGVRSMCGLLISNIWHFLFLIYRVINLATSWRKQRFMKDLSLELSGKQIYLKNIHWSSFFFISFLKYRRLDELLQQLKSASIALGNTELGTKFDECSNRIRRDIVFAASLYL